MPNSTDSLFYSLHVGSGLELLAFCSSTFAPDSAFIKPLLAWLLETHNDSISKPHEKFIAEWAQICIDNIRKAVLFGDRKLLPSFQELEAIKVCDSK